MKLKSILLGSLFSILISIPIILPFLHKGYFPTHDGEWAVVRAGDMFRALRDGQFPPRISGNLNFGYGYPLFNFTYPLPYYLATALHVFKFGFVDSIKILFASSVIVSSVFMFLAASNLWENTIAGIFSAILYTYLPYRFVDLFVRGSLGESLAFALFPLLFFLFLAIEKKAKQKKIYTLLAAISYAALIMSHNIMAVYFSIMLVGLVVVKSILNKKINRDHVLFILSGILLSAFFWLPALFEKHLISLSQIPIADRNLYFVTIAQLFTYRFGYGSPTELDGFTYQIGLPQIISFFLILLFALYSWKKKTIKKLSLQYVRIFSAFCLFFIFLLFSISQILWTLPLLSEINYPWTLLLPIGFILSLLAGFLGTVSNILRYVALAFAIFAIILYLPFAKAQYYIDKGDQYYLTNEATTTSSDELMPLWVRNKPTQKFMQLVEITKGEGIVTDVIANSKHIGFTEIGKEDATLSINRIYYPGWEAFVNGKKTTISYANTKGIMIINVPLGENHIELALRETPLRLFADSISILSFLLIIFYAVFKKSI